MPYLTIPYLTLPFARYAAKDLRNRALGMNFLVAGGTTAAYLYSVVLVLLAVSTAQVRGDGGIDCRELLFLYVCLGVLLCYICARAPHMPLCVYVCMCVFCGGQTPTAPEFRRLTIILLVNKSTRYPRVALPCLN